MLGLASVGRQPCSVPCLPAWSIRCSTSRTESRYSSNFRWSDELMLSRKLLASASTASSTLLSPRSDFVLEQPVERQRGIQFQRRRRGRRTPRDVRAVDHRVVLVDRRVRLLAAEHQARHFGRSPVPLGHQLVDAGAGANLAARGQRRPGKQIAGLGAVDVPLQRLGVVQPADEEHLFAEVGQRREHLAELHLLAARPWPTTPCCESRSPKTARPAAPAPDWRHSTPGSHRPRRQATPSTAEPSRRRRRAGTCGEKSDVCS